MSPSEESPIGRKDLAMGIFFLVFLLVPLLFVNLTHKKLKFLPPSLSFFYSTSRLFTNANYIWPMPYIQVRMEGDDRWMTLPQEDYFKMETFGYRTRLFEALYLALNDAQKSNAVREEMALWIRRRYQMLHPGQPVPVALRFVAGLQRARPDAVPRGHWEKPPFAKFAKEDTYVISEHHFNPLREP